MMTLDAGYAIVCLSIALYAKCMKLLLQNVTQTPA